MKNFAGKFLGIISFLLAMVLIPLLSSDRAAALWCPEDGRCERGGGPNGWSQVRLYVSAWVEGDRVRARAEYRVEGVYGKSLGCYLNRYGQGYLIYTLHNIALTAPGHPTVWMTPVEGNHPSGWRLNQNGNTKRIAEYNTISIYSLAPNVNYTVSLNGVDTTNDRRHICSISSDPLPIGTGNVSRRAVWSINGQSYIGVSAGNESGRDSTGHVINRKQGENAISNVRPGQKLHWDHDLRNVGHDNMRSNEIIVNIDHQNKNLITNQWSALYSDPKNERHGGNVNQLFYDRGTDMTVTQNEVGNKVCQRVAWAAASSSNSGWGLARYACADVPYNYEPPDNPPNNKKSGVYATSSGNGDVFMGDDVPFKYHVVNRAKSDTKTKNMPYRIYTFTLKDKAGDIPNDTTIGCSPVGGGDEDPGCLVDRSGSDHFGNATPDKRFGSNVRYWTVQKSGNTNNINPNSSQTLDATVQLRTDNAWRDTQPGDRVCTYIAVDQWAVTNNVDDNRVRLSKVSCYDVGKKPQLQIRGGDSKSQDGFEGSTFKSTNINPSNKKRGSFSQYGLISLNNSVSNFGSAGYVSASGSDTAFTNNWCKLIYANASSTGGIGSACGGIGNFDNGSGSYTPGMPTIDDSKATTINGEIDLSSLNSGLYKVDGVANISGSLRQGVNAIVKVNGNAYINSNIGSDQVYASLEDVPNLTLYVTGSLIVSSPVTRIDATLITNKLMTCASHSYDWGIAHGYDRCNVQLKINGSVISTGTGNSLLFQRTFGGGNNYDAIYALSDSNSAWLPSEVVNLSPNAFLVPYIKYSNDRTINTYRVISVSSLPARY